MNTFPTLLRFELRTLARDRSAWLLAALLVVTVVFATVNGLRWASFQRDTLALLATEQSASLATARALAGQITRGEVPVPRGWWNNPADVRGFALYQLTAVAAKPPAPLAALTVGQGDLLPYYFKLNAATTSASLTAHELENPRRLLLGRFDLAFAVIFLAPLFLLALAHHVVAAEKETGLLALLAAAPVSVPVLVTVKLAVRAALLTALGLTTLITTLALGGFDFATPGALSGLLRWLLVATAYGAFWLGLTALLISRGWNSATNALALSGAWLALVVIAPWLLNLVASSLHPLPSRADFILTQRAETDAASASRDQILARYLNDHPELNLSATPNQQRHYTASDIATRAEQEARLAPVQARFDAALARQQALIDRWQWLSPAVLASQAFTDLAGAGWQRHRAFLAQLADYLEALRAYFNPKILAASFAFDRFDEWPRYTWREPTEATASSAHRASLALLGLTLPALAFAALSLRAFRRYPVTS
jgi:ABC-2 type transport system permease protein